MIDKKLYMFWTGDNDMSDNRKRSVEHVSKTCGVELCVLYKDDIEKYEKSDNKFHKAYNFLSYTHKADYLRCYFMHFYGGCYSDVKITNFNWSTYVDILNSTKDRDILGYTETAPQDIGIDPGDPLEREMRREYNRFIGNGAYLCKKRSKFTSEWYEELHKKLDQKIDLLMKNPSKHPQDHYGKIIDGKPSIYPFMWTEICGNIFHKVCYLNNERILHGLPRPICKDYR